MPVIFRVADNRAVEGLGADFMLPALARLVRGFFAYYEQQIAAARMAAHSCQLALVTQFLAQVPGLLHLLMFTRAENARAVFWNAMQQRSRVGHDLLRPLAQALAAGDGDGRVDRVNLFARALLLARQRGLA